MWQARLPYHNRTNWKRHIHSPSQELTSSILAVREYPFTGTAFALYQDMEHTVDPEQYNRLESRINSWFYYDTEMPDGDPALHLSFLERVTEPAMQAWLMQMMTGFDQQENAKIQASGQELAFEGYNYDGFETKLEEAVLGEQTQAVLLTPNQDFTELSRNCRKISYLSPESNWSAPDWCRKGIRYPFRFPVPKG